MNRKIAVKRTICYVLLVILPSESFISCAGGRFLGTGRGDKYVYVYEMIAPVKSPQMIFQDDSVRVQFKIDDSAVRFQLENLSHSIVYIQWNRVSLGIDNRFSFVRHSMDFYSDTSWINVSTLIPPGGYILETLAPVANVCFDGTRWVERDLFPTSDGDDTTIAKAIARNVGKPIVLILGLQAGSSQRDYKFEFRVSSVAEIQWKDYRPPKRNPPPQRQRSVVMLADEITAAFIIVGLLGFAAFMVSLKKQPVTE